MNVRYVSPRIMGREAGLHPVIVMVAVLVGGTLFGLLGIIIGPVLIAVLKAVLDTVTEREPWVGQPPAELAAGGAD